MKYLIRGAERTQTEVLFHTFWLVIMDISDQTTRVWFTDELAAIFLCLSISIRGLRWLTNRKKDAFFLFLCVSSSFSHFLPPLNAAFSFPISTSTLQSLYSSMISCFIHLSCTWTSKSWPLWAIICSFYILRYCTNKFPARCKLLMHTRL